MANNQKLATCQVEGDEVVLRIPVNLLVFTFDEYESESVRRADKVIHASDFADAFAEQVADGETDQEYDSKPFWGMMADAIFDMMADDLDESIHFEGLDEDGEPKRI